MQRCMAAQVRWAHDAQVGWWVGGWLGGRAGGRESRRVMPASCCLSGYVCRDQITPTVVKLCMIRPTGPQNTRQLNRYSHRPTSAPNTSLTHW